MHREVLVAWNSKTKIHHSYPQLYLCPIGRWSRNLSMCWSTIWYKLDQSYEGTKDEVWWNLSLMSGSGTDKILQEVTTKNGGKISVWPSALREYLVPLIRAQPEERNLKVEEIKWNHGSQRKWSLKSEKKTWMDMIAGFKCENWYHSRRQM